MTPGLLTAGCLKASLVVVRPTVERVIVSLAPRQDIFVVTRLGVSGCVSYW